MNPKLTITVDAKNRALSVASGMITVGAKIDVEISGLPGDIPPWGADDAFSGPSVRFRLVDELGRDLARYPLAEGDGWEPSGGVLSSLTPVEFDTDRLRRAFRGVAFDDTLPFGVIVDSAVDAAQYAVGRVKVRQWAAASTEDPTVLPDWRGTLDRLQKDLAEVSEKRDDAVAAKAAAVSAASEAQSSRNEAAASASSALAAKNDAEAARDRAEAASGDFDGRLKDYAKKEEVKSDLASKADLVGGKVPVSQLPSYVSDVIECDAKSAFPASGDSGKIYVAKDTNLTYRWSGTAYVEISPSVALGETAETAYPGDRGLALSDKIDTHVANTDNPHGVTAEQVGALPATKKTDVNRYEVSHGVDFLSGFRLENHEAGVRLPVMFSVVDNETEEVTTFKITIPPVGGSKIDFTKGNLHTFLEPDGSDVLTKDSAAALYPTKAEVTDALAPYATRDEIPTVPTKVSAFENDAGYVKRESSPVVIGSGAGSSVQCAISLGDAAYAASFAVAVGAYSDARGMRATSIGQQSSAMDADSTSVGANAMSHGAGSFNISQTSLEQFFFGDTTLGSLVRETISENVISHTNPAFSNAVLAAGLDIDTDSVAVLNEIANTFGGFPVEGTATTVGGLLAALAAAVAWLKRNKADKATTLAGYGITDAAKQTDLEALAAKVGNANARLEEVA